MKISTEHKIEEFYFWGADTCVDFNLRNRKEKILISKKPG